MNHAEIMKMDANQLKQAIAIKLGWHEERQKGHRQGSWIWRTKAGGFYLWLPFWEDDVAEAMQLAEWTHLSIVPVLDRNTDETIGYMAGVAFLSGKPDEDACFQRQIGEWAFGETLCLAICRAVLWEDGEGHD